jgi:3-oxoacyl-[acyl-carrier protein] reductase
MKLLENKIAFVTGGSRGIGAAIVEQFAAHGATVGFSYHQNSDAATNVLTKLPIHHLPHQAYRCDVSQPAQVQNTMQTFLATYGRIDILVNNAGLIKDNLLTEISLNDWNQILATNLTAAYLHIQEILKIMIAARSGTILNISSVVGIGGNAGQANYAASKAGLIGLTKSVAKEVGGRNIRCNAIAPGIIETDMTQNIVNESFIKKMVALKRIGTAEEVAHTALFLASDWSKYITGQVIPVCGGLIL